VIPTTCQGDDTAYRADMSMAGSSPHSAPSELGSATAKAGIAAAHEWFERHSGWAPPDHVTLAEWMVDGVCRCPDECLVEPAACCEHGLASWWLVLTAPRRGPGPVTWDPGLMLPHPSRLDLRREGAPAIIAAHEAAVDSRQAGYADPQTGLFVMTARYHWERNSCCDSGCRHCPFLPIMD
jgi:hypothetical protein